MNTNINGNGVLIRKGTNAILPISDAQYIQYHNSSLTTTLPNTAGTVAVENVKDGLDALYEQVSNATPMTEITYANLVEIIAHNGLKPGTFYRITDYQCTTTQSNTQSANHPFDVIVLATSKNTLSEEARAIQHSGDTYFANSNLNAWKIWYCLENNKVEYAWADDSVDEGSPASITSTSNRTGDTVTFIRNNNGDRYENDTQYYNWELLGDLGLYFTLSETPEIGDVIYFYSTKTRKIVISGEFETGVESYTPAHEGTGPNGRGVIYRLIDEFNNDCPYDFKNIQFKRKLTDGQYDPTNGIDTWVYTFNAILAGTQSDNSLGLNLALAGGSGIITICAENVIKPFYDYDNQQSVLGGQGEIVLNNNVFLCNAASLQYIQSLFVYANKFDVNSMGNTFKDVTYENTFGSNCMNNTFGDNFYLNIIGKRFISNTTKHSVYENIIGNDVSNCQFNWWCDYNTFGNNINNCVFGSPGGYLNNSDSGFYDNTIGNGCSYLSLIGDIANFTIGNGVYKFYTTAITTSSVIVESGVSYVTLDCPSSDDYTKRCQNITIAQGVSGTNSAQKVITHPTVNDNFQTIYKPTNSQIITV